MFVYPLSCFVKNIGKVNQDCILGWLSFFVAIEDFAGSSFKQAGGYQSGVDTPKNGKFCHSKDATKTTMGSLILVNTLEKFPGNNSSTSNVSSFKGAEFT